VAILRRPTRPLMKTRSEVWFIEQSLAASFARLLKARYILRPLSRNLSDLPHLTTPNGKSQIVCLADLNRNDLNTLQQFGLDKDRVRVIGISRNGVNGEHAAACFATLHAKASPKLVRKTIGGAFANIELAQRERAARADLRRTEHEMAELTKIGVALSETHNVEKLLEIILTKSRHVTGADAGSLYIVEETPPDALQADAGERGLRFKITQNDSLQFPYKEFVMPMEENSLAGHTALHGNVINLADAYRIPRNRPYRFNRNYDQESGYRTKSLLTLPMNNGRGEVIGVLQLINCKARPNVKLTSPQVVAQEVRPFSRRAVRMALSLAAQAGVAFENSRLYSDIQSLFEGFVQASVTAIEQRDPTTSGHSQRVSHMTLGLAEVVDRVATGAYANTRFSAEQMKEIRYAALLHDFGKVAVREEVLVKAKKLYPSQMEIVSSRFDYIYKDLEARTEREKVRALLEMDRNRALTHIAAIDEEYRSMRAEIEDYFRVILRSDQPTVLPAGQFERIREIAKKTFQDPRGEVRPFLTPDEVRFLSIPQGTLDPEERVQIESHVVHSFNFLLQIPWTKEIRGIPRIVRAHHEKLNGAGYPYRLKGDEIPVQAKIMTICDIFDALSAADRPYKKAVPTERALDILEVSVKDHELDPELFRLFLEAKIFQQMRRN
jgi:HD-GYP domain-containing protein (c-di-GMP phosphodiesterase class II)